MFGNITGSKVIEISVQLENSDVVTLILKLYYISVRDPFFINNE